MSLVEKQAEEAREAWSRQKPDLALECAMVVLTIEPDHAGMLALVAECIASVEAPRERPTVRLPSDCLWHAHHGEHAAAVVALLHVVEEFPDRDWTDWAVPWLEQIPDHRLPLSEVLHYLALLIRRFPKVVRQREAERAVLRRAFPLLDALEPRLPQNTTFFVLASEVARKAADGARALRYAERALELSPTYDPLLTSATCRRLLRRTDEAVSFLQRAIALDASSRVELEADIGQALYEGERYAEALRHWQGCDPLRDDLSLHFVRWRAGEAQGDQAWADWFESMPADLSMDEAHTLIREPHVGWLVEPTDAPLRALQKSQPGARLEACSSDLEVPSVWLTARLAWGSNLSGSTLLDGADLRLVEPRPGGMALWNYVYVRDAAGNVRLETCAPLLPEPSPETRRVVEQLASSFYLLTRWWAAAPALAAQVDDSSGLAAMLTRVNAPPPEMAAWEWVLRVQRAATLLLARRADGFQWLCGIALGTPDWSTAASVLALTELALDCPERSGEVRGLFLHLAAQAPSALRSYESVLLDCALRLPDWPRASRDWWQVRKQGSAKK